jgi:hypothetical protein
MIRRTVHYLFRDDATPDERRRVMQALAFVGLECSAVRWGDYGDDVAGGSGLLLEVPPWERAPRFRLRGQGPPSNHDAALHLDFDDETGLAAFESDPAALELERVAGPVVVGELTSAVDWHHQGSLPARRGAFRHSALHVWRDEAGEPERRQALAAVRELAGAPGVESATTGESATGRPADYDWALDVLLADEGAARAFIEGEQYAEASAIVAAVTKNEWTTRVTHTIRGS